MTRPHHRSPYRTTPTPAQGPQRRSRARRATRMTVGVTLLLAVATGVTVGAAAYSRNAATENTGIAHTAADAQSVRDTDVARSTTEARDLAEMGQSREVIPGLAVTIGDLRVFTDPSGLPATTLPLQVLNTGDLTRSFDITIVALSDKGEIITSDVGTAANLRPGQAAELQVLELVGPELADRLQAASFRIDEAYAY
ncbi:hypothetical protein [Sporichthya polymorpha]|uniref:hypothetical protein n=1 Tax=Sporichthya polymorpha TaxID=35751 RepID=UPI0003719377|nr:hypothetical protein [Sporichthya polymorpha]